ncbi:acetylhydrolase [Streptomyces rubellomurinus subsp. indigoferus]|uniref:Acetylhydrolase n=1 Tax=Streptomyces rubellomurinus (strain ATCC 31215) TaxID=359131 RepID=A0A0F2TI33_STRR3|nr:acetylhydrolase [Streptomyces rubellomurinus]KJS55451.1 acetylhydrolase [Streptomyces rubellomurinus subsp. indigoferus]KJS62161.1 acetylhydrolase [Streptomyces rubellomurinus]
MSRLRRTAAAAALLLALPLSVATAVPALAAPSPGRPAPVTVTVADAAPATTPVELPRPTGPFAVGLDVLHLVDEDRPDPWVPSAGPRQLMVSMYYPAHPGTGSPAPYMTPEAARLLLDAKVPGNHLPTEALTGTRTWARADARPQGGHYPLIVLSPGFTAPRTELTGLAEDLTSRGYVVALVDHTYENSGTTFPDGTTLPCTVCGTLHDDKAWAGLDASRAKDVSFVLDRLTDRPHPAWRYARLIDRDRIGMAGHSAGGAATVPALLTDDRIKAGADLDGSLDYAVPDSGIGGKPYLMLGRALDGPEDKSWTDAWARLDGWRRWITFHGANHLSFTDLMLFSEKFGLPTPPGSTMSAQRGVELTRAYVAAFFDLQLKGIDQPLLDGPTPANPEVTFHS